MRKTSLALLLLWGLALWFLVLPFFAPRGYYLGYYRVADLAFGLLFGSLAAGATLIWVLPAAQRRTLGIGIPIAFIAVAGTFLALDVVYTLFILGAWQPNYWLDRAHISRAHNLADPELGFVRKAHVTWASEGQYRTDHNGFRNAPWIKEAGIVFVGDSYTEAAQVPEEDTFVNRVASAAGMRAVNLGRGGYGPQQELIVLRRYGLQFHPKYIVWQLFDGNDLSDAEEFRRWRSSGGNDLPLVKRYFASSLSRNWLKNLLNVPEMPGPPIRITHPNGTVTTATARYPYRPESPRQLPNAVEEARRSIEEGSALCKAAGVELIVVFIPTMVQVNRDEITFVRPEDGRQYLPPSPGGTTDFAAAIAAECARSGCTFVNTLESLRQASRERSRPVYIPADEHLTRDGHAAVAAEIFEVLTRSKSPRKERAGSQNRLES